MAIPRFPLQKLHRSRHRSHSKQRCLFSSSSPPLRFTAFHVPIILSQISFRCPLYAYVLDAACNDIRYFINSSLTLPHTSPRKVSAHFYAVYVQTRTFKGSPVRCEHSHHGISTPGIQVTQPTSGLLSVMASHTTVTLCRLYRASDHLPFEQSQSEYQWERFGALLRHSTPRIISSPKSFFHQEKTLQTLSFFL